MLSSWISLTFLAAVVHADYHWPSPQFDALEEFYYEGIRGDGTGLGGTVMPCRPRITGTNRIAAAEWLRLGYHDAATHMDDGSGGMDGSIVFELDRGGQNIGQGMIDSVNDFQPYPSKYVSRADVIAAAVTFAVAACGGPVVPFRGGRIDAMAGGSLGVPEPQQDIATHTSIFARQGFNATDMIGLTACGHTLGGVRAPDFPTVLSAASGSTTDNPTVGLFDTTQLQYDNTVVLQYLDGTTNSPLVVTPNTTMRSDLRIYSLDNNATMHTLADPATFQSTCKNLLTRMINLVPSNVTLTDEISLLEAKVSAVQLSIDGSQLSFKATFRVIDTPSNSKRVVTLFWCDRYGDNQNCSGNVARYASYTTTSTNQSPVTSALGLTLKKYIFSASIDPAKSISNFWFQVDEKNGSSPITYDNGGTGYVIEQDQVLFVPSMSTSQGYYAPPASNSSLSRRGGDAHQPIYNATNYGITVAVRSNTSPSRVYMDVYDNTLSSRIPLNETMDLNLDSSKTPVAGYTFYTANISVVTGTQTTIDIHSDVGGTTYTDDFRQLLWIAQSPFSTTVTASTTTVSNAPAASSTGKNGAVGREIANVLLMTMVVVVWGLV